MLQVEIFLMHDGAKFPEYGTDLSSCFDLSFCPDPNDPVVTFYDSGSFRGARSVISNALRIEPGDRMLVPTGIILKLCPEYDPADYSIRLHPRSGLSLKKGLILANSEGVVDVDYQEEIFAMMTNIGRVSQYIEVGERICQAEIVQNVRPLFLLAKQKPEKIANRSGGFGSTGHK
jgi:dUTP pyrophosphatase